MKPGSAKYSYASMQARRLHAGVTRTPLTAITGSPIRLYGFSVLLNLTPPAFSELNSRNDFRLAVFPVAEFLLRPSPFLLQSVPANASPGENKLSFDSAPAILCI
jgi:hypothetical protein